MIKDQVYAVIDIGTNTFHILIISGTSNQFKVLFKERKYVKLGQGGVKVISAAAFQRGITAMKTFKSHLDKFHCTNLKCIGTAAMRKCTNAIDFQNAVLKETSIPIEIVSGTEEANYIFKGVKKAFNFTDEKVLLIDIGGGSVEFIIANDKQIFFAESYPIGMAILKEKFHQTDRISIQDLASLNKFVLKKLEPLLKEILVHNPKTLIGSSGTFEVLEMTTDGIIKINENCKQINLAAFENLTSIVFESSLNDLRTKSSIPDERIDLITVGLKLISIICTCANIEKLISCKYALKEGVLFDMMN